MIEQLTKKGKLPKGQYLSRAFFEKQIEQSTLICLFRYSRYTFAN